MAGDNWTDEECRFFFHLYADEKKKGNKLKTGMNQTGKDFIMQKFEEKFKRGYPDWKPFKNKLDTSKKSYVKFRALTHRTGISYDSLGRVDMPDDWWKQRIEECGRVRKYRTKLPSNMDVLEEEYGSITVTGGEGWSAQHGEDSLNSKVGGDDEDVDENVDTYMAVPETQTQAAETQTRSGSSRSKRKRKGKDAVVETASARNEVLEKKTKIAEQILEREYSFSVHHVIERLNELPGMTLWSTFHKAAMENLIHDEGNRMAFMAFPKAEDKIKFLEFVTGRKVDDY